MSRKWAAVASGALAAYLPLAGGTVIEFGYPAAWGSRIVQNWGPAGYGNVSANSFVGPLTGHASADLALADRPGSGAQSHCTPPLLSHEGLAGH